MNRPQRPPPEQDTLLHRVREHQARRSQGERQGPPSLARQFATIGVLGWLVVTPALLGLALGRWLDRAAGSGVFWTAPLLILGLAAGCWVGWRWMQGRH